MVEDSGFIARYARAVGDNNDLREPLLSNRDPFLIALYPELLYVKTVDYGGSPSPPVSLDGEDVENSDMGSIRDFFSVTQERRMIKVRSEPVLQKDVEMDAWHYVTETESDASPCSVASSESRPTMFCWKLWRSLSRPSLNNGSGGDVGSEEDSD